jgi:hypothetical protein
MLSICAFFNIPEYYSRCEDELLYEKDFIDYALMIDADEVLVFDEDFDVESFKSNLCADIYDITTDMGGFLYNRPTLTSNKRVSKYEGVVHEFLSMQDGVSREKVVGFKNHPIQDSNRNRSGNKFIKDAVLIEEALKSDISDWFKSRYTFYLAQSYRDSGETEKAISRYLERSLQGFWEEEVYMSLYTAANLMKGLNYPQEKIIHTYLRANEVNPNRAEAYYGLVNYCRLNGLNQLGYIMGKNAIQIQIPQNGLFVEKYIYDYALLDEFSIVAYWSGHMEDAKISCERLLQENKIPLYYYDRVKSNLQFALDKLS